jgi:hypothetical protein
MNLGEQGGQYEGNLWKLFTRFLQVKVSCSRTWKQSGKIAPHIFNLATIWKWVIRFRPKRLYAPATHLIRAECVPQPGWTLWSRQNPSPVPRIALRFLSFPSCSHVTILTSRCNGSLNVWNLLNFSCVSGTIQHGGYYACSQSKEYIFIKVSAK